MVVAVDVQRHTWHAGQTILSFVQVLGSSVGTSGPAYRHRPRIWFQSFPNNLSSPVAVQQLKSTFISAHLLLLIAWSPPYLHLLLKASRITMILTSLLRESWRECSFPRGRAAEVERPLVSLVRTVSIVNTSTRAKLLRNTPTFV